MISDERLVLIERLVNASLNEETGPSKVSTLGNSPSLTPDKPCSGWDRRD